MTAAAPSAAFWSIARLARAIQVRELSPVDLVELFLRRHEAGDDRLRTTIVLLADQARAAARAAEAEIGAGHYRGPLHGIPLGIKDLFDVAGVPTTFGSTILRDNVPERDATAVRRLREAGAIMLAKQNLHEFAFGTTSENPHYGPVRNPWDESRVAGGSSGGAAASIAAGLAPAGLGSDTGGSIRIPAGLCGVSGIKPTYGVVSRAGALPLAWSLDHVGPLARTAEDCALLLDAMVGPDPADGSTLDQPLLHLLDGLNDGVRGLRIGVPRDYFFDPVDSGVDQAVRQAIQVLADQGAEVREVTIPQAQHAQSVGSVIMSSEGASWHGSWIRDRAEEYGQDVLQRLRVGTQLLATEYLRAQTARRLLQDDFAAAFRDVDVVASPTLGIVAPPVDQTFRPVEPFGLPARAVHNRLTVPANLTGMPAATVPCGFVQGLPVGLQVMGPAYADALVLRVAHAYQQATDWHLRQPPGWD